MDKLDIIIKLLSKGTVTTLEIFFLTIIISLPLGLLLSLGRKSKNKWISTPIKLYILIVRGTPLMLQIIFIYFAPYYMMPQGSGLNINRFVAVVIAFALNYAAYFCEIFRGGIESISKEQYEAASSLGFTKGQTFFRIILPQVIKRILPACSNEVINLVKDTALAQIVGVSELFRQASNASSRYFSTTPLFMAGIFYLILNWFVTITFSLLEKKLDYYK
ncbi:MAG: amino acid ABC transporter permease [Clostridiaceae bacterium]